MFSKASQIYDTSPAAVTDALKKAADNLFRQQHPDGYWWYTLEANESIGAGTLQVLKFLNLLDEETAHGLALRMLSQQRADGSWALFFDGPGDLSITIECYLALRLVGYVPEHEAMKRARAFILANGGLTKMRVFSRIHLALFGLAPWSSCPSMPVWFMLLPGKGPISIYEFSTWARASIVPLLLIDAYKPVRPVSFNLDELYVEPRGERIFRFPKPEKFFSLQNFFVRFDKVLKLLEKLPWHPGRKAAIRKAERWTREHIARTEDIYPAMAYAILALSAQGHPNSDPTIQKALNGLKKFRQKCGHDIPPLPSPLLDIEERESPFHQQCCISPNWDTPWAATALLSAGIPKNDERLLKAARYLISKEIKDFRGDWTVKNPKGPTGGWAFEFENDYFPDIDDTIQAVHVLNQTDLPQEEKLAPILRGVGWMLSMQCDNGGWAAFDKNNTADWVNRIPFSDHGACQDPPTPDITGRMLELLAELGFKRETKVVQKALRFIYRHQESNGSWRGRWGVNYIYGTWCVLKGLAATGEDLSSDSIQSAVRWLKSIQNKDGGWGESCLSDTENQYVPLGTSTASQTAWAVMALIAAGEKKSDAVVSGVRWLIDHQDPDGGWPERHFTGTGFPGHFYIRYHGYRYFFPTMALGGQAGL